MQTTHDPDAEYVEIGRSIGLFYRRVNLLYQRLRPDHGLERSAYTLLSRLGSAGPARLTALADDLELDLSTVSRQVAALESRGLATRTADPADRRASVITATATGTESYRRYRAQWVAALRGALADWTPDERDEFARLFARLNESIAVPPVVPGPANHGENER
ncbi:MarR family winged helix-turn-helix transcriptional regulator [Polymorphospora rubra]|uniref:MarR family winged helix-turn-helix transcriptional regulator n=1 Tax=Polymorphospora rubra TaxID=338584 RepID=UPI0033D3E71A